MAPDPVPRARRVRKPAEQRRREILAAATTQICARGFHGLAIQDVAEACQLTVAGLLHHFPSKHALLIGVLEDRDRRDLAYVASLNIDDPVDKIDAMVEYNAGQPEVIHLYAVLGAEAIAKDHPAHEYFQNRYDQALDYMWTLLEGVVDDAEQAARHVIALMDGLQLQWLYHRGHFDLVQAWQHSSRAFLPRR